MTLTVALQMDPIHSIDVQGDSTLMLGLEAQRRGHKLYHYLPQNLSLKNGAVVATGHGLTLRHEAGNHFDLGAEEEFNLADLDVILLRQDPPFDLAYLTTTWLLEKIHPSTLVVNDPSWVRAMPEKIFVTEFPDLMPPTLITSDPKQAVAFREEHKDIIVKPLYGNGGAGVFHLRPDDENLSALIELYQKLGREPFMVQRYLPEVRAGDKRIILIDGHPAGAVLRVPADGEARANMHVGGRAVKTELSKRDLEICARIGPTLRERGQIFVGIDVIGDYLTEINVTSPTGIQQINRLNGVHLERDIWDAIERRL
ncbi:glutathione synthase [Elstera cyanobacteriorum]|uniref:glutathione synthase n=1 Tax=Elstera cyanobacteriorum TaxID=2022747 RepID=UPI002355CDDF|nr:glutathione synthase [Elstera cyanobacteriorum]MCK6441448.1 glutathione synthase [Elstera cyanobacteriorum]